MPLCSACRKEFSPPANGAVPYRCPHCQSTVLGPYCDLQWIGGGGMGDVYRARDTQMGNRTVAIKIPLTEVNPRRARQRFEREIAASALLEHENAVRAYHRGQEAGRPYLVMEFVSGRKLSDLVREQHPLSARRVGRVILGVARALQHAEQHGLVNRDVKPGNVILAEADETPKVLDYGLALILGFDDEVTRSGSQLGTPSFMAPEQEEDPHSVTVAADVYSLGCTAFFCLTGRAPFQAAATRDLYQLHAEAERPRVRQARPDVAEPLDDLIRAMMVPDPARRPSPGQVVETLQSLLAELSDRPPPAEPKAGQGLVDVTCPSCDTVYHLSRDWVGKQLRCPNKLCGKPFTVQLPQTTPTPRATETTRGAIDLAELPQAEIVDAEPVEAQPAEAEPVGAPEPAEGPVSEAPTGGSEAGTDRDGNGSRETLGDARGPIILPASMASEADSHSDIEMLPSEAVVADEPRDHGFAGVSPPPVVVPAEPVGAKAAEAATPAKAEPPPGVAKPRKSPRQRRARNLKWIVAGLCAALFIGSAVIFKIGYESIRPPTAEERWARIMEDYGDHKWERVLRQLDEFEEDFPDDDLVEQIPFFRDFCRAGGNIYSLTGDPVEGWETLRQFYVDHRDNPAYKLYSIDVYQALVKVLRALTQQVIDTSDPDGLALVHQAYELIQTVGRSREEPFVADEIADLGSQIARVEHNLAVRAARDEIVGLLDVEKIADPGVDVDEIYRAVEVIFSSNPELRDDRELMELLSTAYAAEPGRVRYADLAAEPVDDHRDPVRQGYTLVVAWGGDHKKFGAGDDPKPFPEPERMVFALARGILYAFDKQERTLCWARRLGIDSHRLPIHVTPTPKSPPSLIAVNSEDNRLLSLDPSTGEVRWRYRVGQDIVAPLTIVPRQTDPNAPVTRYGLLPTAEGDVHVVELVLGRRLGLFQTGHPITLGGCYDDETRLAFFAADAKRVFAIDPAVVDPAGDTQPKACRSILFSNHPSGSLRSEPVVVGPYLILSEASELEHTRLRVFPIKETGFARPDMSPLESVRLDGWAWFSPECTPDRITLVTDQGDLGLFGLNLDNPDEALYPIIEPVPGKPTERLPSRDVFRTMAVHAEEHLLWVIAGGSLQKLSVDVLGQKIVSIWNKADDAPEMNGIPVHEPQIDRADEVFYLTTMSPSGHSFRFTAVDAETGDPRWKCRLGFDVWGDPLVWDDRLVMIDRTGQTCYFRPSDSFGQSDMPRIRQLPDGPGLPPGADPGRLMRLGSPPGPIRLVAPVDDGARLAVKTVVDPRTDVGDWIVQPLPAKLHGRPCVANNEFLVVPCRDGYLHRLSLDGKPVIATNERLHPWAQSRPPGPDTADAYPLTQDAILLVHDYRSRVCRLELTTTAEGVTQWREEGVFHLSGAMQGGPLVHQDRLFVFDPSGVLYCLDPANPSRKLGEWPVDVEIAAGPFLRANRLVAITGDARLVCFDVDDPSPAEQPRWLSQPFDGWIRGMPQLAGDVLLVADGSRSVTGVRLSDGTAAWTARLEMRVGPSAAPVPYGTRRMMVPLVDGTLVVLPIPEETEQAAEAQP